MANLQLVDEFNNLIEELHRVTEGNDNFSMAVLLHQTDQWARG